MKNTDPCREALVTNREPLALDLLLTDDQRRTSILEKQIAFREAIESPVRDFDDIDEFVGDPAVERFARHRKESQANRVLAILDDLERSGG